MSNFLKLIHERKFDNIIKEILNAFEILFFCTTKSNMLRAMIRRECPWPLDVAPAHRYSKATRFIGRRWRCVQWRSVSSLVCLLVTILGASLCVHGDDGDRIHAAEVVGVQRTDIVHVW